MLRVSVRGHRESTVTVRCFSISETVFEIFRKKLFLKKLCKMLRFPKTSWLGSNNFFFFYRWEYSLPWTAQSWQCFRKIRSGGVFSRYFEPLYLKNCWTYQNEHGSIRSSWAPFFLFFLFFLKNNDESLLRMAIDKGVTRFNQSFLPKGYVSKCILCRKV